MYTFCPDCNRQYRVRAQQLSTAHGLVICGYCGKQFNALVRLHDRPRKLPVKTPDIKVQDETVLAPDGAFLSTLREEIRDTAPDRHAEIHFATDAGPRIDLAEALLDEEPGDNDKPRSNVWPAGVLAMLMLLALQFTWFNRDDLLQRYPELMPWAEGFCVRYNCNLTRQKDLSAIKILNRDVRPHPNYADTLLVNATMANQSEMVQPFPKIQFTLFDTNGQMLGYREFTVEEYLDRSIDTARGMLPGQPVHFVLEIAGITRDAVSFEFRFL